ncbi:MAG: DUF1847 domain-containing protein [Lentisphaeria bacterium]|nr:DUF1847 domain-containing protein [Lentisphaeria bacterium]
MSTKDAAREKKAVIAMYDEADHRLLRIIAESKTPGVSRTQEIVNFAKCLGCQRIGIAHCVGVAEEAQALERMLSESFEVTRVDCKVFGIDAGELIEGASGAACNPVGQAKVLADAGTELNVVMGLCLGHDLLFAKHSTASVTTLTVKDRVHDHNPIAALREVSV